MGSTSAFLICLVLSLAMPRIQAYHFEDALKEFSEGECAPSCVAGLSSEEAEKEMKKLGSKTYMCLLDCAPSRLKCAFNCPLMDGWRDGFTGLQSEDWMTVCDSVSSRCNGCVEDCANMTGAGTTKVANITLLFTVIAVSLMF